MRSLLSLLTLLSLLGLLHSKAVLQDNGYRELVVAISPDVPESQDTLDQIKNLMTEASRELFIASRKRAYYKRIKILLPKTWTNTQTDQDLQGGSSSIDWMMMMMMTMTTMMMTLMMIIPTMIMMT